MFWSWLILGAVLGAALGGLVAWSLFRSDDAPAGPSVANAELLVEAAYSRGRGDGYDLGCKDTKGFYKAQRRQAGLKASETRKRRDTLIGGES
jgi:hypothetical protein